MMRKMTFAGVLVAAVALSAGAEETVVALDDPLPGQAKPTATDTVVLADRKTHESLKHPFVMLYYVEPTVKAGETAKIAYYVTDFAHSKVRFGDDSKRFDVVLQWSADKVTWQKLVQNGVKSGDGVFEISGLTRGDYFLKILCRDEKGVLSRTVWSEFRVRTADELAIKDSETARPTAADLAKAGVTLEKEGFYAFEPVDIGDIEPMCSFRDQIKYKGKKMEAEKKALHDSIHAKVAAAIESERGKQLVAAHPEGYVVFAPAKNGHFIYRSRDYRRIVPGAKHDAAALEATAAANSKSLTKYFADLVKSGKRKVVLPKGTIRLSYHEKLLLPSRLTVDLGGGKLKLNTTKVADAEPIEMFRAEDAHLVNGTVEGVYFEYDYENCGTGNPEHVATFKILGDARFCSIENMNFVYTVSAGTSFDTTWLEEPFAKPKWEVREWLARNACVGFGAAKPVTKGKKVVKPGENWDVGRLTPSGEVRDAGEGCFTSPFRALGGHTNRNWFAVSKFLGYRGMFGPSDYFTIAFYDAEKKFLQSEIGFQYHRILVPPKAAYMRISTAAKDLAAANACELKAYFLYAPQDCVWRNVRYEYGRTQGLSIMDGFNMLFEDIEIARCGDESCRCASDAEDGWDGMQNMTFRRINCHDNPNGDFTVCCGHSFVYENCSMRFNVNQRVHSALFRNCTIKGGSWNCLTLTRDGYKRFENNTFVRGITLGTPSWYFKRHAIKTDWEIVLNDAAFKGKSAEEPMRVEAGLTGRYRNCTFENCQLVGPKDRFTDCKIGDGCSTAEK